MAATLGAIPSTLGRNLCAISCISFGLTAETSNSVKINSLGGGQFFQTSRQTSLNSHRPFPHIRRSRRSFRLRPAAQVGEDVVTLGTSGKSFEPQFLGQTADTASDELSSIFSGLAEELKRNAPKIKAPTIDTQALTDAADSVKSTLSGAVESGSKAGENIVDALTSATESVTDQVQLPSLDNVKENVASSLDILQSKFSSAVTSVGKENLDLEIVQDTVQDVVGNAQDALDGVTDAAKTSLSSVMDAAKGMFSGITEAIKVAAPIEDGLPSVSLQEVPNLPDSLTSIVTSAKEFASEGIKAPSLSLPEVPELPDSLTSALTSAKEFASEGIDAIQGSIVEGAADNADIPAVTDALDATVKSAGAVGESVSKMVNKTTASLENAVTSTGSFFSNTLDAVNSRVSNAVSTVKDSVNNAVSSVENAVSSTVQSVETSINTSVETAQSTLTGKVENLQRRVVEAGDSVVRPIAESDLLKRTVDSSKAAVSTALSAVGGKLTEGYGSVYKTLPPEYRSQLDVVEEKLAQVAEPTKKVLSQATDSFVVLERKLGLDPDDPVITVGLFLGGTTVLGFLYWRSVYGGYSGDLSAQQAFELLQSDDSAVLVDIRPEDIRERDGIPDLRRTARFRRASIELDKVEGAVRGQVRNAEEVDYLITAAQILNLKQVSGQSKVVVMDSYDGKSKEIARALKKLGLRRPYRVEGGFRSWTSAGLRVRDDVPVSAIEILKEETQDFVEEVKPTPIGIFTVVLGIVAGTYALIEYEKTLQFIGVVGLGQSAYRRVRSYKSTDDLKNDFRLIQQPFVWGAAAITWGLSLAEPTTSTRPALAASASSGNTFESVASSETRDGDSAETREEGAVAAAAENAAAVETDANVAPEFGKKSE